MKAAAPAKSRPALREACFADYPAVAALLERNGLRARPEEEWRRLWVSNPAYDEGWPIGWVLESEGQIVGALANLPASYVWRNSKIRAAVAIDWAVDEGYRAYSLVLMQRATTQPDVDLLMATSVGPSAEPGYAAVKWSRVRSGEWNRSGFWVTSALGFAESALRAKSTRVPAACLKYPLSFAMVCRRAVLRYRAPATAPDWVVERWDGFDSDFDRFWLALQSRHADKLLAVRDRATLAWHFRPSSGRILIGIVRQGAAMQGYIVLVRNDNEEIGLKRMRLADFQSLDDPQQAFRALLAWACKCCRQEGIHVLEDVGRTASRLGIDAPYDRPLASWSSYFRAKDETLAEALRTAETWAVTSYDGDAALVL